VSGCKSNFYLHKDINDKNYQKIFKSRDLGVNDTIWLNRRTVCVKLDTNDIKIGTIKNGKEKGKWLYYYTPEGKDTIDCYFMEFYRKRDTVKVMVKAVNPRYLD
jgi:hypothetical protein